MKKRAAKLDCENCESRQGGLFCALEMVALERFNYQKTTNHYKKGQVIFYENNQPFGLYCVNSGRVKLYKEGIHGRPQILRIAGPGDLLGYRSLFAEEPYHATAEILEDANICFIDKSTFFSVLNDDLQLSQNIIKKLSQELGVAEELASSLAQRSARERMAELLLILKKTYGQKSKQASVISLKLSREELGSMIGLTQETAIRLLSDFKKQGWIELQEREIRVVNSQALLDVAHLEA